MAWRARDEAGGEAEAWLGAYQSHEAAAAGVGRPSQSRQTAVAGVRTKARRRHKAGHRSRAKEIRDTHRGGERDEGSSGGARSGGTWSASNFGGGFTSAPV